jgi:activator of HSP90 ATPase
MVIFCLEGGGEMKTKTIRQSVTFKASPQAIYEMLTDSRKHSKFTGEKASISRKIGGKFTAYAGYISGVNLDLVKDKRIVQSWRGNDWPEGHYSRVTFSLEKVKSGARLIFRQSGVPEVHYKDIHQGWRDYYWKPMRERMEKH